MTGETPHSAVAKRVRRHVTGREHLFFAVVQPGFEATCLEEFNFLCIGSNRRALHGGVEFTGRLDQCYRANIECRTATRILMRVAEFRARRFSKLRDLAGRLPWELYLSPGTPVSFNVSSRGSRLYHTGRIETEFRRAISARPGMPGPGPAFDESPDKRGNHGVFVRFDDDLCTVSIDSTGEALYRRGSKIRTVEAPLRETTAAGILLEAGIRECRTFADPMCGSGTFSLEAGLIALNIPPGLFRSFAFEAWPSYGAQSRAHLVKSLSGKIKPPQEAGMLFHCSDRDENAAAMARANLEEAGLNGVIVPRRADFFTELLPLAPETPALLALNPPFGKRLSTGREALAMYRKLGEALRGPFNSWGFAVIAPGGEYETALGLPYEKKIMFSHGGISAAVLIRRAVRHGKNSA